MALATWCALAVPAAAAPAAPTPSAPRLTAPPAGGVAEAPEGHLLAAWEPVDAGTGGAGGPVRYQLEIGRDPGFERARVVETGADAATLLSGLRGGDTWLRVRAIHGGAAGPWSEPGTVRVDYPDPGLVRNLFALGAVTCAFLLAAIVVGVRRTAARREASR